MKPRETAPSTELDDVAHSRANTMSRSCRLMSRSRHGMTRRRPTTQSSGRSAKTTDRRPPAPSSRCVSFFAVEASIVSKVVGQVGELDSPRDGVFQHTADVVVVRLRLASGDVINRIDYVRREAEGLKPVESHVGVFDGVMEDGHDPIDRVLHTKHHPERVKKERVATEIIGWV